MSELTYTTIFGPPPSLPSSSSSCSLPDEYSVPVTEEVPAVALHTTGLPPVIPHLGQPQQSHPFMYIPPPHELSSLEPDDGYTPEIPLPPLPVQPCMLGPPSPYSSWRQKSPSLRSLSYSPVRQCQRSVSPSELILPYRPRRSLSPSYYSPVRTRQRIPSEDHDHFVRRSQQWDSYDNLWVHRRPSPPPVSSLDPHNYFYLNIRFARKGDNGSLVFSDFSPVLESLLRTVFSDVRCGATLEYPIQRLFQKMNVLQDKLDDAIDILDDEYTLDDLTSKAKTFGFKSSSEGTALQYLNDLVAHLGKLLEVVEAESKQDAERLEELLADNKISFDLLEYYYEEGAKYAHVQSEGYKLGTQRGIVPVVLKKAHLSDDGTELNLELEHLEWDGVRFLPFSVTYVQESYEGTKPIKSLLLQPMTDEMLAEVTERGKLYLSYCKVMHAEYYNDTRIQDDLRCSNLNVKSRVRRVMIDPFGYHYARQGYNPDLRESLPDDAEENIPRLPYWIAGYDLDAREWKAFALWDLKPLECNEEAWRNLILDKDSKDLIRSLVDSTGRSLDTSYLMSLNKGKNVLLDGPAGTGKMTAVRAVCDLLKRPMVTMYGDEFHLGTDQIASFVSLAVTWNAVIVVKDADAYLKAIYKSDRDCVVAVLRQLEGDDCISFWLTNGCNEALLSSFCAVINFPELDAKARRRLWLNHFGQPESAKHILDKERALSISSSFTDLKKIDYSAHLRAAEKLSWHQLDGKMIENIVRSARAVADANGEHLSVHHVKSVMKAQRLDQLPLWRKATRVLMFPVKVLHTSGLN